jgi:hypothetical protein
MTQVAAGMRVARSPAGRVLLALRLVDERTITAMKKPTAHRDRTEDARVAST